MADLIVAWSAPGAQRRISQTMLRDCGRRLGLDVVAQREPIGLSSSEADSLEVLVVNPQPGLPVTPRGACLGAMLSPTDGWDRVGRTRPDGSYAVVRFDRQVVQVLADECASRTVWHAAQDGLVLASTSQRALVNLLGSFDPDPETVSWLASSGTLGPGLSWDRRIRPLSRAATMTLDRGTGHVEITARPVEREPDDRLSTEAHVAALREAVIDTCGRLDIDLDTWLLPLSGGADSRAILLGLLAHQRRPHTITWGLRRAADDEGSDVSVARVLAERTGVTHRFVATDIGTADAHTTLTRFLVAGEGRTSQIAGYLDGLALWAGLQQEGIAGIIRGDESNFWAGDHPPGTPTFYRLEEQLRLIDDYPETHLIRRLGLSDQHLPEFARPHPHETHVACDERLYVEFHLPFYLAPLTDIKAKFVEVANPLLSRAVASVGARLPDPLKTERVGFMKALETMTPDVPYALRSGTEGATGYLRHPAFLDELIGDLSRASAEYVCPREGLDRIVRSLSGPQESGARRSRRRRRIAAAIPAALRRRLAPAPAPRLSTPQLALRLYIAAAMHRLLRQDAEACTRPLRADGTLRRPTPEGMPTSRSRT